MRFKLFFLLLLLCFLIFCLSSPRISQASNPLDVVINEIAWMGTNVSANDEWIELYNNSSNNINLEGWVLKSEDGTPEIKLTGAIPANGFFLLERTDDETLPGISADQIYKGALGNNGENLKLFDNSGNLVDQVNCSSGWFSGDNETKQTMERKNSKISDSGSQNWQSSQNPGGTPKTANSKPTPGNQGTEELKNEGTKEKITEKPAETGSPLTYPGGVVFNEILPSPEGSDAEEEWIEIFNQNEFEVNLSGWKIKDTAGKITTYTFSKETKISSQGFLVLKRPETKITLNNDEDGLILSSPDGKIIDEVNYKKAPQGQSYNRQNSDWLWSSNLTPGTSNIVSSLSENKKNESSQELKEKEKLAASQMEFFNPLKTSSILLIALIIAIFSGVVILILKLKVGYNKNI